MNQSGVESSNIFVQNPESKWNRNINIDFRSNYLLNRRLNAIQESDYVSLIGSTPRYEAASLNVRLRQPVIKKNLTIASTGFPTDPTYPIDQLGNGMKTLYQIAQGRHNAPYEMFQARNPNIISGSNSIQREDGDAVKSIRDRPTPRTRKTRQLVGQRSASCLHRIGNKILGDAGVLEEGRGAADPRPASLDAPSYLIGSGVQSGILHAYASTPGAHDLNVGGQRPSLNNLMGYTTKQECLYLVGADFDIDRDSRDKSRHESKKPLIIYQGHHGDLGARQADIIPPPSSYVEKSGLYVNTEGRVQQSQAAIRPAGAQADIRDDLMILQALSNLLPSGLSAPEAPEGSGDSIWLRGWMEPRSAHSPLTD
jgi:NADH dehydrogenase/NADH:ubiquinone oxidoreductase subunit G